MSQNELLRCQSVFPLRQQVHSAASGVHSQPGVFTHLLPVTARILRTGGRASVQHSRKLERVNEKEMGSGEFTELISSVDLQWGLDLRT